MHSSPPFTPLPLGSACQIQPFCWPPEYQGKRLCSPCQFGYSWVGKTMWFMSGFIKPVLSTPKPNSLKKDFYNKDGMCSLLAQFLSLPFQLILQLGSKKRCYVLIPYVPANHCNITAPKLNHTISVTWNQRAWISLQDPLVRWRCSARCVPSGVQAKEAAAAQKNVSPS